MHVYRKYRFLFVSFIYLSILLVSLYNLNIYVFATSTKQYVTHTSLLDFSQGTKDTTLDINQVQGDLRLGQYTTDYVDTTYDDFYQEDVNTGAIASTDNGESVRLDKTVVNINHINEPVAHYTFDEGSGDIATNTGTAGSSINGNLGATEVCPGGASCPTWTSEGKYGGALNFDGVNDYVKIGNMGTFSQVSFSMWTKVTNNEAWPISTGINYGGILIYNTYLRYRGFGIDQRKYNLILNDGWKHIVVTADGANISFYLNGEKIATFPQVNSSENFSNVIFGQRGDNVEWYQGTIDDIRIYNYALSESEIETAYLSSGTYLSKDTNLSSDLFTTNSPLPQAIMGAMSGVIDGKIYTTGAMTSDWDVSDALYMYNPSSNTWETKTSMSTVRGTPALGVIDGKLYVAGGRKCDYSSGSCKFVGLKTLEVYTPGTNTWETKASMAQARIGPAGDVYDGKLYVVGGANQSCGTVQPSLEVYTPGSNSWQTKTPIPITKAMGASAKFINGKLYVVGGQIDCDNPFSNLLTVYDPNTDTWDTSKANLPENRSGGVTVVYDGKLLYIGGTNDDYDSVSDIFQYDPSSDTWGTITSLPDKIHRAAAQVINDNLYVVGGRNNDWDAMDTVYSLNTKYLSPFLFHKVTWDSTTPLGTSVEMFYSLDNGDTYTSLGTTPGTYYLPSNSLVYTLKYKSILRTTDTSKTPYLNSVTLGYTIPSDGLYTGNTQGTYTSPLIHSPLYEANWDKLTASVDTPGGTSVNFYTRSGNPPAVDSTWSAWDEVEADGNILSANSRYVQYKVVLETTDINKTPVVHDITLSYDEVTPTQDSTYHPPSCSIVLSSTDIPVLVSSSFLTPSQLSFLFVPVKNVDGYSIYYGTDSSNQYAVSFTNPDSSGILSYTIKDLYPSTQWKLRLQAYKGCGTGVVSPEYTITTKGTGATKRVASGTTPPSLTTGATLQESLNNEVRPATRSVPTTTPATVVPTNVPTPTTTPANTEQTNQNFFQKLVEWVKNKLT